MLVFSLYAQFYTNAIFAGESSNCFQVLKLNMYSQYLASFMNEFRHIERGKEDFTQIIFFLTNNKKSVDVVLFIKGTYL